MLLTSLDLCCSDSYWKSSKFVCHWSVRRSLLTWTNGGLIKRAKTSNCNQLVCHWSVRRSMLTLLALNSNPPFLSLLIRLMSIETWRMSASNGSSFTENSTSSKLRASNSVRTWPCSSPILSRPRPAPTRCSSPKSPRIASRQIRGLTQTGWYRLSMAILLRTLLLSVFCCVHCYHFRDAVLIPYGALNIGLTLDSNTFCQNDATVKRCTVLKSSMSQLSKHVCSFSVASFYQKLLTIL